jgi:hypothetical protein
MQGTPVRTKAHGRRSSRDYSQQLTGHSGGHGLGQGTQVQSPAFIAGADAQALPCALSSATALPATVAAVSSARTIAFMMVLHSFEVIS